MSLTLTTDQRTVFRTLIATESPIQFADDRITSIGVGITRDASGIEIPCIRFTMMDASLPSGERDPLHEGLPSELHLPDGTAIPTRLVVRRVTSTRYRAAPLDAPIRRRKTPISPGLSISPLDAANGAGTIGCIVSAPGHTAPFALTAAHVLETQASDASGSGEVIQPGLADDGGLGDAIGRVADAHRGQLGDFAIAEIYDRAYDPKIVGLGVIPRSAATPELGDHVVKSGRTTGETRGRIVCVEMVVRVGADSAAPLIPAFEIAPLDGSTEISLPGDSGSLWMKTSGPRAPALDVGIGIHIAGEPVGVIDAEYALACPLEPALRHLNLDFVTHAGAPVPRPMTNATDVDSGNSAFGGSHFGPLGFTSSGTRIVGGAAGEGIEGATHLRPPVVRPSDAGLDVKWDNHEERWATTVALSLLVVSIGLAIQQMVTYWAPPGPPWPGLPDVPFFPADRFRESTVPGLLAAIGFVALLVERALDAFLSVTRGPIEERKRLYIRRREEFIAAMEMWIERLPKGRNRSSCEASLRAHQEQLERAEASLKNYRIDTRTVALCIAMMMGLALALNDFRLLAPLFIAEGEPNPSLEFEIIDILLTAVTLAAGSAGMHRLSNAAAGLMRMTPGQSSRDGKLGQ